MSLLLVLLLNSKVYAFEIFEKISSNPLKISFLPNYNEALQTHIFKENNIFKGIFSVKSSINNLYSLNYATSIDGTEWTIEKNILTLDKNLFAPRVLLTHDGKIKLFFTKEDNPYKIYKIDCDNEFNCNNISLSLVLEASPGDYSESKGVFSGYPYYNNGIYYLFYGAWGNDGFKIKLATSPNGINWSRCPGNQPIVWNADGSFFYKKENKYYLFFHSADSTGIQVAESTNEISCNMQWENFHYILRPTEDYDRKHLIAPSILEFSNSFYLYYTGLGEDNVWRLNLAISQPTSTPTPPLTPTPTPKTPFVLLPGLMASWNKEAILHNQPVSIYDWKLAPFVKEYEGIRNTLKNLGYIENQDFYLFAYDWRKGLNDLADDLNLYLNQLTANHQPPISHFNLVGHSLGGLVGRIYLQKYGTEKINKLITVGSPHQGAPQVYKAIEAGELDRGNNLLWLAQKIILVLNKTGFETDKDTINRLLSVAKDLLPTYNFLKNQNNQEISINNMQIKNETLLSYQNNFPIIFPYLQTIAGEKGNTLMGFKVGPRTILDQLLNLYPDGRPTENFYQIGDFTVTSTSARAGNQPIILNFDHGEIIYKRQAIKEILETLGIDYQENQIVEGEKTDISPSLIFLIRSPAEITVEFNGQIFSEQEGIIFIKNASDGDYTLNVTGKEKGRYTVIIGQIGENNDRWQQIEGEITQSPPSSQTDSYQINFNPQSSQSPVSNPMTLFDEIILYLTDLNKTLKKTEVNRAISNLHQAKQYHQQNNKGRTKSILLLAHKQIFQAEVKSNDTDKRKLLYAIEKLENLYENALLNYRFGLSTWRLKGNLTRYKKIIGPTERYLLSQKQRGKNVVKNSNILLEIEKRVNLAEKSLNKNNLNLADILLKSVEQLIKEVRKL